MKNYLLKIGSFIVPNDWISKKGYSAFLNDLDSDKTTRGALGNLFRYRLAEVPEIKLKIIKSLSRSEFLQLASAIRPARVLVEYYNPYKSTGDGYVSEYFYITKVKPTIKTLNPLRYEPFDLEITGFDGVKW